MPRPNCYWAKLVASSTLLPDAGGDLVGNDMQKKVSSRTRAERPVATSERYESSSRVEKGRILDEFERVSGLGRAYGAKRQLREYAPLCRITRVTRATFARTRLRIALELHATIASRRDLGDDERVRPWPLADTPASATQADRPIAPMRSGRAWVAPPYTPKVTTKT